MLKLRIYFDYQEIWYGRSNQEFSKQFSAVRGVILETLEVWELDSTRDDEATTSILELANDPEKLQTAMILADDPRIKKLGCSVMET